MTAFVLPNGKNYFADSTGAPLVGGKVYTYVPGTSTPKDTYTTSAGSVANTNPVVLDSRGEAAIYWNGAYDVVLKTSADVTVWGPERLNSTDMGDQLRQDLANSAANFGSDLVALSIANHNNAGTVGGFLQYYFGRTAAEISAGVTPSNYGYRPYDPRRYGADATGASSSTAEILTACNAAAAAGEAVRFSGSYKMSTTLALTSSHNGLKWILEGATITKGGNIDLVTVTNCSDFNIDGIGTFDGLMTSYTGRGFVVTGSSSNRFYIGPGIVTKAFASAHVEFGQDAGSYAKLLGNMYADPTQVTAESILKSGATDTGAMQRFFGGSVQGHITLQGALATRIQCPLVNYVGIDDNCSVTIVTGTSWSNNGTAIPTIGGAATIITGCRFSDNVTLGVNMSGAFVGNAQNGGTFTDNTTGGNCIVIHHRLASDYQLINKCFLPLTGFEIQALAIDADWGDSSPTFNPLSYKPIMAFRTPLTANRTLTLSTTGARNGQTVRVVREAGATGASTLSVGGLKTLAVSQWADVVYDSNTSSWRLTAFGSL